MMIMDLSGLPLGASRPARRRRFPPDLANYPFRGRLNSFSPVGGNAKRARAQRSDRAALASNSPLPSLEGEALARRFHAWSGRSGRRYICSVFSVEAQAPFAGLPDFAEAIVIAVAIAANGLRTPIAIFDSGDADGGNLDRPQTFVADALAQSVCEWHVHLLATDAELRRSVKADLERGCAKRSQFADPADKARTAA